MKVVVKEQVYDDSANGIAGIRLGIVTLPFRIAGIRFAELVFALE